MSELPSVPSPRGEYLPAIRAGGLVISAGMTPRRDGELVAVGAVTDVAVAARAAGLATANALAAVADLAGGLDRVVACVALTVYIAAPPGFSAHSTVADGASTVLVQYLGSRGRVARAAIGVTSLPGDATVEVVLAVTVRDD